MTKRLGEDIVTTQSEIAVVSLDLHQGYADLAACNRIDSFQNRFDALNALLTGYKKKLSFIDCLNLSLINFIMNITVLLAILIIVPDLEAGAYNGVMVSVIVLGIAASFEAVYPLPRAASQLGTILRSAKRVFDIIDTEPSSGPPETAPDSSMESLDISFDHVSFSYHSHDGFKLDKLSFRIKQNSFAVLVGGSGSGKSTLINLLLRFWDCESGVIRIGGHGLNSFRREDLAHAISVCPQSIHMFNDSVIGNLRLANESATEEDAIRALKVAEAYEFVRALPNGLYSSIGENGHRLSGGEVRRLGIARAVLSKAPVLVLDEPNADLDNDLGSKIIENLYKMRNRTIIIVTHIYAEPLSKAEMVLVMKNGSIVEQGSHDELSKREHGLYRRMLSFQHGGLPSAL